MGGVAIFEVNPPAAGRLVATVHTSTGTTRLSLRDGNNQTLLVSDGQGPGNPDDRIDLHLAAGPAYLEVESLGGPAAYDLTTAFTPSTDPSVPIPLSGNVKESAIAEGDFNNDKITDLLTPYGVYLGISNGTGPGGQDGDVPTLADPFTWRR